MKVCLLILTMSFTLTAYSQVYRLGDGADAVLSIHDEIELALKIQYLEMIIAEQESAELRHLADNWPQLMGQATNFLDAEVTNLTFSEIDGNVAILMGTVAASINNGYLLPPLEHFNHPLFQKDYVFTAIYTRNLNGGTNVLVRFTKVPYNF